MRKTEAQQTGICEILNNIIEYDSSEQVMGSNEH